MAFQKDNFEDDNELSRLEDDEELGGEAEEVVEAEEEELTIVGEEPGEPAPAPKPAPKPAAKKPAKKAAKKRVARKKTVSLSYGRESFSAKGPGARFRPFLFWGMSASRMGFRQRSPVSQLDQRASRFGNRPG